MNDLVHFSVPLLPFMTKREELTFDDGVVVGAFVMNCRNANVFDYDDTSVAPRNLQPEIIKEWFDQWFEFQNYHPDDRMDWRMDEAWGLFCEEVGQ